MVVFKLGRDRIHVGHVYNTVHFSIDQFGRATHLGAGDGPGNTRSRDLGQFVLGMSIAVVPCTLLTVFERCDAADTRTVALDFAGPPAGLLFVVFGVVAFAVGLGARFPDLKENSPAKIAAGFGGTLTLIVSALYVVGLVTITALPTYFAIQTDGETDSFYTWVFDRCRYPDGNHRTLRNRNPYANWPSCISPFGAIEMQKTGLQRREVHYSGRVQGVGFRYTVAQIARRHPVTGFVENLPNGQVHLTAEGDSATLNAFLAEIQEAMSGNIKDAVVDIQSATGDCNGFSIRR